MKKPGSSELSQNRENIKQTRAQRVARAVLTPSDAGQAAGIWGQQRQLPLNCFLSAQLQIIHAWLHHGGEGGQFPWMAPTTGPAPAAAGLERPGCQAGGGPDLLHGGDIIFKLTTSNLHLCFKSRAQSLHMPLSAVKQRWSR